MLTRLQCDASSSVEGKKLLEIFELECKSAGLVVPGSSRVFLELITKVYPSVVKERKTTAHESKTMYKGLKVNLPHLDQFTSLATLSEVKHDLPDDFISETETENCLTCKHDMGYSINNSPVYKEIQFCKDGTWKLKICGKDINLSSLYVSDKFQFSQESLKIVFEAVRMLKLCSGIKVTKSVIVTRFHQYERITNASGTVKRNVRSVLCEKIVSLNSVTEICLKCQRMTLNHPNKENLQLNANEPKLKTQEESVQVKDQPQPTNKKGISKDDLKKLIPDINDEMVELFLSQAENIARDPRGRRWTQKLISVCLQWYCRSPQAYEAFRATKMLILPCPSTLVLYKNRVKQDTGFDEKILQWMHAEAVEKCIHEEGWMGGIIIDEMAIQADIQIAKNGDAVELCGLTDLGEEGNDCKTLRTGNNEKNLGTYILQLIFLGLTGFRFPFAHFITNGIQGQELYTLFWEAVDQVQMFGFKVLYASLDGAQSNRNFVKYNLGGTFTRPFKTKNHYNFGEVVFIMDIKHVIKKIRNNILSSGTCKSHTRLLTLPSKYTIQWQMFLDCFKWDKGNSFQLHRKLTYEHFNLSSHSKMRNHLAEEILNSEMLHCMSQYQLYLGSKGDVLNGTKALLKYTSKLIDISRDMRPVMHLEDERLLELAEISDWFDKWQCDCEGNSKLCLSYQCHEDILSSTVGFTELCKMVLQTSKHIFVTPGLINSDVVENIFNQQRSTYNGANANPNALQYQRSLNSIIIGQNSVSTKANAGKGRDAAMPYNISMKNYPAKRQKLL